MVPRPAVSASSGNLLEMQTFGTQSSPTGSKTVGMGPRKAGFTKLMLTNVSIILMYA